MAQKVKILQSSLTQNGNLNSNGVMYNSLVLRDSRNLSMVEANEKAIENGKVMLESHFFVTRTGEVYAVRTEGTRTELGKEIFDRYVLLVDIEGEFEYEDLESVQGNALLALCQHLISKYPGLEGGTILCFYELFKEGINPGPTFPINYFNELVKSNSSFYVKVKETVTSHSQISPFPSKYTWKTRELKYTKPYMNGNDVMSLKFKLAELGLAISVMNIFYDEEAVGAVNIFRRALGLPETGVTTIEIMDEIDVLLNKRISQSSSGVVFSRVLELRTPYIEGEDVAFVQRVLTFEKLYDGPLNKKYTTDVYKAVKLFQARNWLDEDGIVGPITWEYLENIKYVLYERILYLTTPNLEGSDVEIIQQQLFALGYNVAVTSKYDERTNEAMKKFQKDKGMRSDGVMNVSTFNALFGFTKK